MSNTISVPYNGTMISNSSINSSTTVTGIGGLSGGAYSTIGAASWAGGLSSSNNFSTLKNQSGQAVLDFPPDEPIVDIKGRIRMNGEYLDERLKRIEDALLIPHRDVIMEQKYEILSKIWAEYNETATALNNWENIEKSK